MELLDDYIAALEEMVYAGANLRMMVGEKSVGVLSISFDEEQKQLQVGYLTPEKPEEQFTLVPVSTTFTVAFDDLPNLHPLNGWQ